jgi:ABC-type transport system substrate-binding protein
MKSWVNLTFVTVFSVVAFGIQANAKETKYVPKAGFIEKLPVPKKGGIAYLSLNANPKVMNPVLSNDANSSTFDPLFFASLMIEDSGSLAIIPYLAESVTVSEDKKAYTYTLNANAKWEDGTPVTTDDVKFSFDTMMNPKVDAAAQRAYWQGVTLEVKDPRTFTFKVSEPQFDTFRSLGYFYPVQKKQFAGESDYNKAKGILAPVTSGPYKLKSFSRDQKVEIERVKDWWGSKHPTLSKIFNADTVVFRIVPDANLEYERFIKGELDALQFEGPNIETYVMKVKGADKDKFGAKPGSGKPLFNVEVANKSPRPYYYVGWNLRKPIFKSKKTRQALAQLADVKQISDKVFYGYYIQTTSPFGSTSMNSDQTLRTPGKMFAYDVKKAIAMLKEDGWADSDGDNILDKTIDGKKTPFKFELKYNSNNVSRGKIAQILKENFKKAGVELVIRSVEWNALLSDLETRQFEAVIMGWTSTPYPNPRQIWHTDSEKDQGSNMVAYSNPKVDELIGKANLETDLTKRSKIMQEINRILYDDQPYMWLVEPRAVLMGLNSRLKSPVWAMEYSSGPSWEAYQYVQ